MSCGHNASIRGPANVLRPRPPRSLLLFRALAFDQLLGFFEEAKRLLVFRPLQVFHGFAEALEPCLGLVGVAEAVVRHGEEGERPAFTSPSAADLLSTPRLP